MIQGSYAFIQQEQVIWGRPAADAIAEVADGLGARRLFLVTSGTLNRRTDAIAAIRRRLGERVVGLFDECEEHSPQGSVLRAAGEIERAGPDLIVTIGGGSPIDTVKVGPEHYDRIAEASMQSPMVKANPRPITGPAQVKEILAMAQ